MSDSRSEGRNEKNSDARGGAASNKDGGRKGSRSNKYRNDFSGDQLFDYRDPVNMARFISDGGKITPARISKLSLGQQRQVAGAVKKARNLALLPVGSGAYDRFFRAESISPVPFDI